MDKMSTDVETIGNSTISINDRKSIVISGVKRIDSFNDEEFLLETTLGYMVVKGENLEIIKLDTYQGNVSIKGKFNNLGYIQETNKPKEEGLFSKLFK
ncbi:MAG: sporulation protein YabP [Bacilli bacterium]|jgi:sporulation protein YabP